MGLISDLRKEAAAAFKAAGDMIIEIEYVIPGDPGTVNPLTEVETGGSSDTTYTVDALVEGFSLEAPNAIRASDAKVTIVQDEDDFPAAVKTSHHMLINGNKFDILDAKDELGVLWIIHARGAE